jgi:hypothetical protein
VIRWDETPQMPIEEALALGICRMMEPPAPRVVMVSHALYARMARALVCPQTGRRR